MMENFVPSFNLPSPAHETLLPLAMKLPFRLSLHSIVPSVLASFAGTYIFPSQESPSIFFTEITASLPKLPLAEPLKTSSPWIFMVAGKVPHEVRRRPIKTRNILFIFLPQIIKHARIDLPSQDSYSPLKKHQRPRTEGRCRSQAMPSVGKCQC